FSFLGLHPDPASMALYNPLAEGQPDSHTLVLAPAVKPLKNDENPLVIFFVDSDAVVPALKKPIRAFFLRGQPEEGILRAVEFQGVSKKVLKYLQKLDGIPHDDRKGSPRHFRALLLDL